MNKQEEINKIKEAKKNGEVYISPLAMGPIDIESIFIKALGEVLKESK